MYSTVVSGTTDRATDDAGDGADGPVQEMLDQLEFGHIHAELEAATDYELIARINAEYLADLNAVRADAYDELGDLDEFEDR